MKKVSLPLSIALILAIAWACKTPILTSIKDDALYKSLSATRLQLPNQWHLTPAGTALPLGDLPLNMVVSASQKMLAVTNNGVGKQTIQLFSTEGGIKLLNETVIAKSWYGLAFSQDEKRIYASGGNDNTVVVFNIVNQKLQQDTVIRLGLPWSKNKICPTGIALDDATNRLFTATKEDSALYV